MKRLFLLILGVVLAGCEAQATPVANIVTPTATPVPTSVPAQVFRYGVASNLAPYLGDVAGIDYEILDNTSIITDYDLVVAFGIYDGWEQSPQSHRVSLAINPNLEPLDNVTFRDLIPALVDKQMIVDNLNIPGAQQTTSQITRQSETEIRATLANNGFPDGFPLILATDNLPALDILLRQFADLLLDLRLLELSETVFMDNQAHIALFLWTQEDERETWSAQVGEENIIDLWTMPVSYIASNEITIDFSENGIPVPNN